MGATYGVDTFVEMVSEFSIFGPWGVVYSSDRNAWCVACVYIFFCAITLYCFKFCIALQVSESEYLAFSRRRKLSLGDDDSSPEKPPKKSKKAKKRTREVMLLFYENETTVGS